MNLRNNYRALAVIGVSAGLAIVVGGSSVVMGAVAYARSDRPAIVTTVTEQATAYDYYQLPACAEDAPDPSMTDICVWEDDGVYWVMDGNGGAASYEPCATEDSDECVWDSATQGNRNADVDAPDRFGVSSARDAHAPLYPTAVEE